MFLQETLGRGWGRRDRRRDKALTGHMLVVAVPGMGVCWQRFSFATVLARFQTMPNKDRATNLPSQNQGCRCHADTAYQVQTRTFGLRIGLSGQRNPDGRRRQRPTRGGMTVQFSHVDWVVALLFAKTNGPSSCR